MKPILVVDNYDSFTYNLVHLLESVSEQQVVVQRNDAVDIAGLGDFDRVLLSPGPGLPQEAGKMLEVIRQLSPDIPLLGVCLGHQALAVATGGKLFQMPTVQHGVATPIRVEAQFDRLGLYSGLPLEMTVGRYHSWMVSEEGLSDQWRIQARDDQGRIMSMVHQHFPWQGVQFHPESIMTAYGRQLLANWFYNC